MTYQFAVAGIISIDHIHLADGRQHVLPGSCGFYTAMALHHLDAHVLFVGAHGDDFKGDILMPLQKAGLPFSPVHFPGKGASLDLTFHADGNVRKAVYHEGVCEQFRAEHLPEDFFEADCLWMGSAPFALQKTIAEQASRQQKQLYLTTQNEFARRYHELTELLPHLTLLFTNVREVAQYGTGDLKTTLHIIHNQFPHLTLVITRNVRGAWLLQNRTLYSVSAHPSPPGHHTMGAGDTFAATLAIQLQQKQSIENALQWATVAAALKMRAFAYTRMPSVSEVEMALADIKEKLPVKSATWNSETCDSGLSDEMSLLKKEL